MHSNPTIRGRQMVDRAVTGRVRDLVDAVEKRGGLKLVSTEDGSGNVRPAFTQIGREMVRDWMRMEAARGETRGADRARRRR